MDAKQYLNELRAMYPDFEYLREIASLPDAPTEGSAEFDESSAPAYLRNVLDQVTTETRGLTSADDLAALRADVAGALLGKRPELEWPARWHNLFLRNASEEARTLLDQYDIAVGELRSRT